MSHGHAMNAGHATGGVIHAGEGPAFEPGPAPFVIDPKALERQHADDSHVPSGAHLMPSGNWVRLSDPHDITRGYKKALIAAVKGVDLPVEVGFIIADLLLTKLVIGWSYPFPLPSTDPAALDAIPGCDDEAISALIRPARALLFPSLVTPDDHDDPSSPTAPSGA